MHSVQSCGSFAYTPDSPLGRFDYKLLKQFNAHLSSFQENFTDDNCYQVVIETFCKALLRKDDQLPVIEIIDLNDQTVRLINDIASELLEVSTLIKRCVDEESNGWECDAPIEVISDMYALVVKKQLQVDAFRDCMRTKARKFKIPQSWFLKMSLYLNAKEASTPVTLSPSMKRFNAIFISTDETVCLGGLDRTRNRKNTIKLEIKSEPS